MRGLSCDGRGGKMTLYAFLNKLKKEVATSLIRGVTLELNKMYKEVENEN